MFNIYQSDFHVHLMHQTEPLSIPLKHYKQINDPKAVNSYTNNHFDFGST